MVSSHLEISPVPSKISWARDVDSNSVALIDFNQSSTTELAIHSDVVVEHYDHRPLDFLVDERAVKFPYLLLPNERIELWPYLIPCFLDDQPAVSEWISQFWRAGEARVETYTLLDQINRAIAAQFTYEAREEVGVKRPKHTLTSRTGSCRDFATLMIEACRFLGLPARFVSGYATTEDIPAAMGATHAWTEVFLPGAGWKGFDSTGGVLTGPNHIAVAVGRDPESLPPVAGAFGSHDPEVKSKLVVRVNVTRRDTVTPVST
jgi:transglutaminase-like putative cysteine protease